MKPLLLAMSLVMAGLESAAEAPKYIYDVSAGETDLIDPIPARADAAIRAVCRRFAAENDAGRAKIRNELGEQIPSLTFAMRQSVFAMRTRDKSYLSDALMSLALLKASSEDDRDIALALALVHHAAIRIGVDANGLIRDAARLADPSIAKLMVTLVQSPDFKDLRKSWLMDEVTTANGVGFIERDPAPYTPTYDLSHLAIDLGHLIDRLGYKTTSVSIATELPTVWFGDGGDEAGSLLGHANGGAAIHADMRSKPYPPPFLIVFVQELDSAKSAQRLLELASNVKPQSYIAIPFVDRNLFCLLIARSGLAEEPNVETPAAIKRFAEPIRKALAATRGPLRPSTPTPPPRSGTARPSRPTR